MPITSSARVAATDVEYRIEKDIEASGRKTWHVVKTNSPDYGLKKRRPIPLEQLPEGLRKDARARRLSWSAAAVNMTDEAQQPKRGRGRPPGTGHPKRASPKLLAAAANYARHGNLTRAGIEAGYSPSYSKILMGTPAFSQAVDEIRSRALAKGEYNLQTAMAAFDDAGRFARETGNATALVRAEEMKAKLAGLMVERVDQRQVGGFTIKITGVDDELAPVVPTPTYSQVFDT